MRWRKSQGGERGNSKDARIQTSSEAEGGKRVLQTLPAQKGGRRCVTAHLVMEGRTLHFLGRANNDLFL